MADNRAARRARNPAKQTQEDVLDFTTKKDIEFYNKACDKLECDPYDGTNLSTFLKMFGAKAKQYNWMRILTFGQGAQRRTLIKHYGEITKAEVQEAAATYLGTNNRRDQDSDMMYNCLRKSVSAKVFATVTTEPERYTFDVEGEEDPLEDGPSFLKAIIDHTYTNTLSNTAVARENLSSLSDFMASLPDSNITEFNAYVKKQTETLAANGETTNDLVTNLFKGYAKVKDKDFRQWIKIKKGEWFDRTLIINPNGLDLMELAENHYKDAVTSKEWLKLDEDQETILALQSQIEAVQAKAKRPGKSEDKRTRGGKKKESSEWDWKKKPPKENEEKKKTVKGKTYHWCKNHELWCLHSPAECNLRRTGEGKGKSKMNTKKERAKMRMKVYQTLMDSSEEEAAETEGSNQGEESESGAESSE
jgi:hypothetical protein